MKKFIMLLSVSTLVFAVYAAPLSGTIEDGNISSDSLVTSLNVSWNYSTDDTFEFGFAKKTGSASDESVVFDDVVTDTTKTDAVSLAGAEKGSGSAYFYFNVNTREAIYATLDLKGAMVTGDDSGDVSAQLGWSLSATPVNVDQVTGTVTRATKQSVGYNAAYYGDGNSQQAAAHVGSPIKIFSQPKLSAGPKEKTGVVTLDFVTADASAEIKGSEGSPVERVEGEYKGIVELKVSTTT